MANIIIFGATQAGKTTLLGYLSTAMLRHPQFNEEILQKLKLIKSLTHDDIFKIGNPAQPDNVNKEVILPSFVSLDRDELTKFAGQGTEGTTKRIHRKQLSIRISENDCFCNNESVSCVFVDLPGFRQRLSDKYLSFFEGNIGIAMIKLSEITYYKNLLKFPPKTEFEITEKQKYYKRLFDPIRVWCDYRSPSSLLIVISQIDRDYKDTSEEKYRKYKDIDEAISCIRDQIQDFDKNGEVQITPISVQLTSEPNKKEKPHMRVFFRRKEENIYTKPDDENFPGDGTFISCLQKMLPPKNMESENIAFSMASLYRVMQAKVNNSTRTAFNVFAMHGSIHISSKVFLGPVIERDTGNLVYPECEIASIKADGAKDPSKDLPEGNVGGIIFKSIKKPTSSQNYYISPSDPKSDLKFLKSTILFSGNYISGDIVEIEIDPSDYITTDGDITEPYSSAISSLMPQDQIFLFWYGKRIPMLISEIHFCDNRCVKLSLLPTFSSYHTVEQFTLPCNLQNEPLYSDDVLIAIPESLWIHPSKRQTKRGLPEVYTYVTASVRNIKRSSDYDFIQLCSGEDLDLRNILAESFKPESISFEGSAFRIPIKSKKSNSLLYPVLTEIGRCLKKISRADYIASQKIWLSLISTESTL